MTSIHARRYPVIDYIYGFPQTIATPKRSADGPWQALADLGFVVVILDGLGTAFRSKAFHDVSYGALQDATLPDHVAALRQLASRYPWVDLERVGIFGSSGGGTSTVRALLEYPEFFRVGVAIAGGYDQRDSIAYILEKYQGPGPGQLGGDGPYRWLASYGVGSCSSGASWTTTSTQCPACVARRVHRRRAGTSTFWSFPAPITSSADIGMSNGVSLATSSSISSDANHLSASGRMRQSVRPVGRERRISR